MDGERGGGGEVLGKRESGGVLGKEREGGVLGKRNTEREREVMGKRERGVF